MQQTTEAQPHNSATLVKSLPELFADLKSLEIQISRKLGPQIFDYLFLFEKDTYLEITLPKLDSFTENLLNQYIATAEKIFAQLNIPNNSEKDLGEKFLATLADIYQLRFLDASKLFTEYQLERVPTKNEEKLLSAYKEQEAPIHIGIFIDNAFAEDSAGKIDFAATVKKEEQEHRIKAYLSAYSESMHLKEQFFYDFLKYTTHGMVPRLFQDELMDINEEVLMEAGSFFTATVYAYLQRGFSPKDARANVLSFFNKILEKQDYQLSPQLQSLEDDLRAILLDRLSAIPTLEPATITDLINEFLELIVAYWRSGKLLPQILFHLEFRQEGEDIFLDSYLIFDTGEFSSLPVETYKISLTDEAKAVIFNYVTGGIENPEFTLEDYLAVI